MKIRKLFRSLTIYTFHSLTFNMIQKRMFLFFQAFLLHLANFNRNRYIKWTAILSRIIVVNRATGRGKTYHFTSLIK